MIVITHESGDEQESLLDRQEPTEFDRDEADFWANMAAGKRSSLHQKPKKLTKAERKREEHRVKMAIGQSLTLPSEQQPRSHFKCAYKRGSKEYITRLLDTIEKPILFDSSL